MCVCMCVCVCVCVCVKCYGMYAVKILASFNPKTPRNFLYWLAIYNFCARSEISSCAPNGPSAHISSQGILCELSNYCPAGTFRALAPAAVRHVANPRAQRRM
jgi:hypothetical protein